jgi:hypothetical protein
MNIKFFEVSKAADEAARLGRWMMDQCYKTDNHELANMLSKVGDMLTDYDTPFGVRWSDFTEEETKFIVECKKIWEQQRAA